MSHTLPTPVVIHNIPNYMVLLFPLPWHSLSVTANQPQLHPGRWLNITHMFLEAIADNTIFYQGWVNNGDGSGHVGRGSFWKSEVGG